MSVLQILILSGFITILESLRVSIRYINIYGDEAHLHHIVDEIDVALIPPISALLSIVPILHYFNSIYNETIIPNGHTWVYGVLLTQVCIFIGYLIGNLDRFYLLNRIRKIRNRENINQQTIEIHHIYNILILIYEHMEE